MREFMIWKAISEILVQAQQFIDQQDLEAIDIDQTIDCRAELRNKVHHVSEQILKAHNAKISKYITFGLVAWLDEMMSEPYEMTAAHPWPSLQQEIYETAEAGIVFYDYLDDVIQNPFYPQIVYRFYYYMLKGGFKGTHVHDTDHVLQGYMKKLEGILGYDANAEDIGETIVHTPTIIKSKYAMYTDKVKHFLGRHYGLSLAAGVALFYGIFSFVLFVK